jgi:hypothetical protein
MAIRKQQIPLAARIPQGEKQFFYPPIKPRVIGDITTTSVEDYAKTGKPREMAPERREKK